ncbi:hypothetical protein BDN70DRAFT_188031 [Pholiota conissans]|uniref:Uncharacterized protein n=1 Tax=Pholiota conissans TaxID=109636 RepID=A0A9P5YX43_9AGAR|nr:hypothetical protein BDN70DRAFT_188031 [Pholiota conissans]
MSMCCSTSSSQWVLRTMSEAALSLVLALVRMLTRYSRFYGSHKHIAMTRSRLSISIYLCESAHCTSLIPSRFCCLLRSP